MTKKIVDTLRYAFSNSRKADTRQVVLWNMNGTMFQMSSDTKPRWS